MFGKDTCRSVIITSLTYTLRLVKTVTIILKAHRFGVFWWDTWTTVIISFKIANIYLVRNLFIESLYYYYY